MSIDLLITDMFASFLKDECPPDQVRAIERGGAPDAMWEALSELGFPDLVIDEDKGGAAASPETAGQVFFNCGAAALPVPLAFTIWLRGILSRNGIEPPEGPITLARGAWRGHSVICRQVPFAATAKWALVYDGPKTLLLPLSTAHVGGDIEGNSNTLRRDLEWDDLADALPLELQQDWHSAGALVTAALIAGAASRCLELTVDYANTRNQFGKLIGKFQAVQQQLSVLAEEVFAARISMQLAFSGHDGGDASHIRAAMAKGRNSEAVNRITAICHGVTGAIGITDEFDLHLFTRRLYEWRQDFGSEAVWYERVGINLLGGKAGEKKGDALNFLLDHAPKT